MQFLKILDFNQEIKIYCCALRCLLKKTDTDLSIMVNCFLVSVSHQFYSIDLKSWRFPRVNIFKQTCRDQHEDVQYKNINKK